MPAPDSSVGMLAPSNPAAQLDTTRRTVGAVTVETTRVDDLPKYTEVIEWGASGPVYHGLALPGSAKSAAAWQIRKFTYDGSGNVTDVQFKLGDPSFIHLPAYSVR